ncbi:MAG: GIY-YIG nuclease family protein [Bacteroidales bacterium]
MECSDGSFYTGSTKYLEARIRNHQEGDGANFTSKRLPVEMVYYEEYSRIDWAFNREHQIKGWSRKKKIALIEGRLDDLKKLSTSYRFRKNKKK